MTGTDLFQPIPIAIAIIAICLAFAETLAARHARPIPVRSQERRHT